MNIGITGGDLAVPPELPSHAARLRSEGERGKRRDVGVWREEGEKGRRGKGEGTVKRERERVGVDLVKEEEQC